MYEFQQTTSASMKRLKRGPNAPRFDQAMKVFGKALTRKALPASMEGRNVVVAVRPEDADDFGMSVIQTLRNTGATVVLACLWTDKDYRPHEDADPVHIVRTEFVEPLPDLIDTVVVALPVIAEIDILNAMWESIADRFSDADIFVLSVFATASQIQNVDPELALKEPHFEVAAIAERSRDFRHVFRKYIPVGRPGSRKALMPAIVRDMMLGPQPSNEEVFGR